MSIEQTIKNISEAAYRPADNIDNGQIDPVVLNPEDFQDAVPLPVDPYLSSTIPVEVEDLDEKNFVASDPIRDNGYMVDPEVDNLAEAAILDRVSDDRNGVVELIGTHDEPVDADASRRYEEALLTRNPDSKILRVGDKGDGFVIVSHNGDAAQIHTRNGKHYVRFSSFGSLPRIKVVETGHVSNVLNGVKLHEGVAQEDVDTILETAMAQLAKDALVEAKSRDEIKALFGGQEGLNEDVMNRSADLFEAAVNVAVKRQLKVINEAAEGYITNCLNAYHDRTNADMNARLDTAINEWTEANKVAIEQNARHSITESFMEGLRELLESHYIDIPRNKVDLYETSVKTGERLMSQLAEQKEVNQGLQEQVNKLSKKLILESKLTGLVATKAERVRELAEAVNFENEKQFTDRVEFIVESVTQKAPVKKEQRAILEDAVPSKTTISEDVPDEVAAVMEYLSRK